jgi:hypothetical protein
MSALSDECGRVNAKVSNQHSNLSCPTARSSSKVQVAVLAELLAQQHRCVRFRHIFSLWPAIRSPHQLYRRVCQHTWSEHSTCTHPGQDTGLGSLTSPQQCGLSSPLRLRRHDHLWYSLWCALPTGRVVLTSQWHDAHTAHCQRVVTQCQRLQW